MRIEGAIRIDLDAVEISWRRGSSARQRSAHRLPFEPSVPGAPPSPEAVGKALSRALDLAHKGRRFFSPRLGILLADAYTQMTVLRFDQLPRSRSDVNLLVLQRFCRQHRLAPSQTAISYTPQARTSSGEYVVICAMDAAICQAIQQSLRDRSLHADLIAGESVAILCAIQDLLSPPPSLLVLLYPDCATLVLRTEAGVIAHIAAFRRGDRSASAFARALSSRLERYAAAGGLTPEISAIDVIDRSGGIGMLSPLANLPYPVRDLSRHLAAAGAVGTGWEMVLRRAA